MCYNQIHFYSMSDKATKGGIAMKMTSALAAKQLRTYYEDLRALERHENDVDSFVAALNEDIESVRPEYDYEDVQKQKTELETKIRKLKHALNVFNATTIIPDFGMTIDEMLVYLPQLNNRKTKLASLSAALPKVRENAGYGRGNMVIDYRYANYDIEKAKADYAEITEIISKAQTALDYVNNTVEFDFD